MRLTFATTIALFSWPIFTFAQSAIHLEAEDAQLVGVIRATTRPSFSGTGYVTGFDDDNDKLIFTVPARTAGVYDVKIRYASPSVKGYYLNVNGVKLKGIFPGSGDKFAEFNAGKIELNAGKNTIAIEKYWGFYDIDKIDLLPAPPSKTVVKPPNKLSDPAASSKAKALFAMLRQRYGGGTFSGVYTNDDADYVKQVTGKTPAIMGGDLIEYSPSRVEHGSDAKNEVERLISASQNNSIITLSWHWNAPSGLLDKMLTSEQGQQIDARWYKGFNTSATTFDVQKALADPKSEDYRLLLRDIDAIAVQLKKLSDADVPILWRPLHEAEGGWFWWGAKGPQPFIQLWRLLHDRLTHEHHLHNLIWVYTSAGNPAWYPGDEYVDVVGADDYPVDLRDTFSVDWETLLSQFAGRKLLAISEFGGVPDVQSMRNLGEYWSYFVSWSGELGPHKMSDDDLRRIYNSSAVINQR